MISAGFGWRLTAAAAMLAIAVLITGGLYRQTLEYGFDYDDYHFVRPYSVADVARTFHGPWDPSGIEAPYFRPLTVAAFACRFNLLGLNSRAHHAVSLALFVVAAVLAGTFVLVVTGRPIGGVIGTLFFAVHPSMPTALVAWITNQMHLLELVVTLLALLWWHGVRRRPLIWWMPLFLAAIAVFLIKEDGVMLLPAIIALHWLRRQSVEPDLPPIPAPFVVATVVLLLGLIAARSWALSDMRAPARPTTGEAWSHFTLGLSRVFTLVHLRQPWQRPIAWFATLLPFAAVGTWRGASAGSKYGWMSGGVLALLFNLPFVYITKHEQMHIVATGAVIVLASSTLMLLEAARRRAVRVVVGLVLAIGTLAFGYVARDISRGFEPFGAMVLAHDRIVTGWASVPDDLRAYLNRKLEKGAAHALSSNPVEALDMVIFGVHPPETSPSGVRYNWMSSARAEIEVSASLREVQIPFRHEVGAFGEPADVEVRADGALVDRGALRDGEWRVSRITLRRAAVPSLARMHRIVISIDHLWVPATIIPGSKDTRALGLQIGTVQVR